MIYKIFLNLSSPLEQFELFQIFFFFNNSSIFMILITFFFLFVFNFLKLNPLLVPSRWQLIFEKAFNFIETITKENIRIKYQVYFPYIYTYFLFVLGFNLIGMIPYSFTVTSHIAITFYLALSSFLGLNLIALTKHKLAYFNLFLPKGVPVFIIPFLVIIETISYIARVFSLSIRLFANMMSGHTLLKILAGFSWTIFSAKSFLKVFSFVPALFIIAVTFLEIAIAFLQAYVFVILLCIYIDDVLNLH